MSDTLLNIDEKISRLKKKREKLQIQQAIYFMREAQKIFQDGFSSEMALGILSETWNTASDAQKQNWSNLAPIDRGGQSYPFRSSPAQGSRNDPRTPASTHQQN